MDIDHPKVTRSTPEIWDLIAKLIVPITQHQTYHPKKSYELGITVGISWMLGWYTDDPTGH